MKFSLRQIAVFVAVAVAVALLVAVTWLVTCGIPAIFGPGAVWP